MFAIITMFFACAVFAFSINNIGYYVSKLHLKMNDYKLVNMLYLKLNSKTLHSVNTYMKINGIT